MAARRIPPAPLGYPRSSRIPGSLSVLSAAGDVNADYDRVCRFRDASDHSPALAHPGDVVLPRHIPAMPASARLARTRHGSPTYAAQPLSRIVHEFPAGSAERPASALRSSRRVFPQSWPRPGRRRWCPTSPMAVDAHVTFNGRPSGTEAAVCPVGVRALD